MNTLSQSRLCKAASTLIISLALLIICGCEETTYKPPAPPEAVDFGIVIFDDAGEEGTSFKKGTDIRIGLRFASDGGQPFQWHQTDECRLFTNKDFLLVYQSFEGLDKPPTVYSPLGTPYKIPMYCANLDLPSAYLEEGTVIVSFPWSSNPDNKPLIAGRYYVTAGFDLAIDGEVKRWDIRHDFEIYN